MKKTPTEPTLKFHRVAPLRVVFSVVTTVFLVTACGTNESVKLQSNAAGEAQASAPASAPAQPSLAGDGSSSKLLKAPTEQFGPGEVNPSNAKGVAPDSKTLPKLPAMVQIAAHSEEPLRMNPTSGGNGQMISNLSGHLTIDKVEPELANSNFNLVGAADVSVVHPEIGTCQLLAKNFDLRATNTGAKRIVFTLMGLDHKAAPAADGCLVKLSTMAMAGFVVEFKNVRLGGPLSETFVPTVRLTVSPARPVL